jgi:hypothetical protein
VLRSNSHVLDGADREIHIMFEIVYRWCFNSGMPALEMSFVFETLSGYVEFFVIDVHAGAWALPNWLPGFFCCVLFSNLVLFFDKGKDCMGDAVLDWHFFG